MQWLWNGKKGKSSHVCIDVNQDLEHHHHHHHRQRDSRKWLRHQRKSSNDAYMWHCHNRIGISTIHNDTRWTVEAGNFTSDISSLAIFSTGWVLIFDRHRWLMLPTRYLLLVRGKGLTWMRKVARRWWIAIGNDKLRIIDGRLASIRLDNTGWVGDQCHGSFGFQGWIDYKFPILIHRNGLPCKTHILNSD